MAQHDDPNWDDIFNSQPEETASPDEGKDVAPAESDDTPPKSRREAREASSRAPRRNTGSVDREPQDKPPRRRTWIGWLVAVIVILGLGAGGVAAIWVTFEDQVRSVLGWEIPPEDYEGEGTGEATVIIKPGDTGGVITQTLLDAGVIKSYAAFYELLLVEEPAFYPGYFVLAEKMSAEAALAALLDPKNKMENSALIQEGWTVDDAIEVLSAGTGIAVEDFEAAVADPTVYGVPPEANTLDGYLFPARYTFDPSIDAAGIITTLVNRTFQSLDSAGVPLADRHRVLTVASLIQREAGSNPEDFYKVSRVIQNRFEEGMLLQFDSTSHYGYEWAHGKREVGGVFSTEAELTDQNPYNTYVHPGLPPGPIAAAGDLAIDAAVNPADGAWLYFVAVDLETGETKFTNTLGEHEAAVDQMRSWCRETKSPNCG